MSGSAPLPCGEKDFRNLAFPLGVPPQHLIALGLFHDQDQIRPCDHLGGQGPGPVPGAVQTFFPEDGNGLGIGARPPEIEQPCGIRLHGMKVSFFQLRPEDSLRHETPAQVARAYEQDSLYRLSGLHGISRLSR
jgi:hypothetical protein